ncbi:hypothetical protein MCETHM1_01964 [Flavobacteriaceae bacterium]
MKKLFFLLTAITLLTSCDKDGQIFASKDQLPPETQTGANTVGCLVNGKVFLPHQEGIDSPVNCFYQFVKGEYYFTMAFADYRGASIESVNIYTAKTVLTVGQTYSLNQGYGPDTGGGVEYYTDLNNKFSTNLINVGELKITRIDVSKSIVSGTFWFDAINSKGEKVEIREGRFDWNY